MEQWVRGLLSPARWQHTEGVRQLARRLAARWGEDEEKADLAALCHDCARELPRGELLNRAAEFGIVRDEICDAEPMLYHGPVAAAWIKARWGVDDTDVLEAIAVHTTGRPGVSTLAKIVYLADALEQGRDGPGLDELRAEAFSDMDRALRGTLERSISYLLKRGRLIHPDTVAARNDVLLRARG